jgi:predicted esterase
MRRRLGLVDGRDGTLVLPDVPDGAAPLVIAFHGAESGAEQMVGLLEPAAERAGAVVLAPESRDVTWDLLHCQGEDALFVARAVDAVCAAAHIDTRRVALAGFSDGASFALGVPVPVEATALVAFSPGFFTGRHGTAPAYVSHGTHDPVLPVGACGRTVARELAEAGRRVRYHEFGGGHVVPPEIVDEAFAWLVEEAWAA